MSNITEMPDLMDALSLLQSAQVIYKDEPNWTLDALNKAIDDCVKKSVRYGRKSTIELKIILTPNQLNQMHVDVALTVNEPKVETLTLMAFTDSKGRLFGDDPNQQKLPLETREFKRSGDQ